MSGTYSDVDASGDPAGAVAWQDRVDGWPQVRAYRRRIVELLDGVDRVADVGCGPGGDVGAVGAERCVGADRSLAMCRTAAGRGVVVCRADAQRLPFADRAFGGVFANRVLQHLADPHAALQEMVRVLRSGGRLVVADPDQETLVIHVPGVRQELVDRVKALRRDVGYRHGRLASALPGVLVAMGLTHVALEPFALSLTDPDDAFGLPGWAGVWRDRFSDDEVAEWEVGVQRSRERGFVYSVVYFVVSGVRS